MIQGKKILGIIPARGGSKGIPRKNILEIAGKPLIAWTIEEARKSVYIDKVVVSTEDSEIANTASRFGADVPFLRPKDLAKDDTPGIAPVLHAIEQLPYYDYIVLLQPTSPLRIVEDIDGCIEYCLKADAFCVSVSEVDKRPEYIFTLDKDRHVNPVMGSIAYKSQRRQELPEMYVLNGAVYVAKVKELLCEKSFLASNTVGYVMPECRSVDIDTKLDFAIAEFLLKQQKNN